MPERACEIVGHRGASGLFPENTLEAFEAALALGVDGVELDARRSSDGHAIVFHDATLERFVPRGARRAVADETLAALKQVDVGARFGRPGCRIPTLDEALDALAGRATIHLECKGAGEAGLLVLSSCLAALQARDVAGGTVLSSFHDEVLAASSREAPGLRRALIVSARREGDVVAAASALACTALHAEHVLVTPWLVARCDAAGLALRAWTVNAPGRMSELVGMGVDGLVTDFPDRARRVLGR